MIRIFAILAFVLSLSADSLLIREGENRLTPYTKELVPNTSRSQTSQPTYRYLPYGDASQAKESNGKIVVSFDQQIDVEQFAARWQLITIEKISTTRESYLFTNASSLDDLTLAYEILQNEPNIRFAKPEWKSSRVVK